MRICANANRRANSRAIANGITRPKTQVTLASPGTTPARERTPAVSERLTSASAESNSWWTRTQPAYSASVSVRVRCRKTV